MEYKGSNSLNNLQGITKESYPDNKPKKKFKKLLKQIQGK